MGPGKNNRQIDRRIDSWGLAINSGDRQSQPVQSAVNQDADVVSLAG
jgi:hypothetical protein